MEGPEIPSTEETKLGTFMSSPNWKLTPNGSGHINHNGYLIAVNKGASFRYWIVLDGAMGEERSGFQTADDAKRAAFNELQDIIEGNQPSVPPPTGIIMKVEDIPTTEILLKRLAQAPLFPQGNF